MCGYVSVCVCVCHMTSGQAGNSNDRAVAAEGGPAGGVWLTLAVTPGFTWGKYARVPLSPTLLHLCLHQSFFWKHAIFTFNCLQHVSYLNRYFPNTLEGWGEGGGEGWSMHHKDPGCLFRSWESLLKTSPGTLSAMMLKVSGEVEVHLAERALSALICETANFKPALHQHCG